MYVQTYTNKHHVELHNFIFELKQGDTCTGTSSTKQPFCSPTYLTQATQPNC